MSRSTQSFLCQFSLQTGADLITLCLIINKVSAVYGLLALLTGYHLSKLQLSMYIYSLVALATLSYFLPAIRTREPLKCAFLAWFYLLDSIINGAYTVLFAISWFLVVSKHHLAKGNGTDASGMIMINDTAAFTNPVLNVSSVNVNAKGVTNKVQFADAPAGADMQASGHPTVKQGIQQPEGLASVMVVGTLWAVRLYCIIIMFSFARHCMKQSHSSFAHKNKT